MLEEDEIEAEVEATKIAAKGKGGIGESSQPMTVVPEQDEDDENNMNKTRVEKMADLSVIGELKIETQFPTLDLDAIVMSNSQYAGKTDFPNHIDIGDVYTLSGQSFIHKHMKNLKSD